MRIATEYLISHGWLLIPAALVGIFIVALGVFMLGGFEQNGCAGFRYFTFVDQRATADAYSVQLINGGQPVIIRDVMAGANLDAAPNVSLENIQPHNVFVIRTEPLGMRPGIAYSNAMVRISYDVINGPAGLADTAWCAGRVA